MIAQNEPGHLGVWLDHRMNDEELLRLVEQAAAK